MPTYNDFKNEKLTRSTFGIGLLAGALLLAPGLAFAQAEGESSGEAPAAVEAATESAPEATATATTAVEATVAPVKKSAVDKKAAAAAAAANAAAASPAAESAASPAAESAASDAAAKPDEKSADGKPKSVKDKNALAQMAATGAPPAGSKPWSVNITLEGTLGAGAFTGSGGAVSPRADPSLSIDGGDGTTALGYSVFLRGFWAFDPKLRGIVGIDFSQPLSNTNSVIGAVAPNEFQFGEILFGALSPVFFTEENTGINFGGNLIFRLPTSKQASAVDRLFRVNGALNVFKTFSEVGPGALTTIISGGLRKDVGPNQILLDEDDAASLVNACRAFNKETQSDCFTNILPINWGLGYSASLIYTLAGNFNVSLSAGMQHLFLHYGGDSDVSGLPFAVGTSPNANDSGGQIDFMFGSLDFGYQFTSYFALRLGMITFQNPYVQRGNNPTAIANPWFDNWGNGAENLTTYYLDFNFFL